MIEQAQIERLREIFEQYIERLGFDGCWLWCGGSFDKDGYGLLSVKDSSHPKGRRIWRAHRLAWLLEHGYEAPNHVCHRCDVRSCVRPDHLFDGDDTANNRDMTLKGRNIFQRNNPSKKLTVLDVFELKLARQLGSTLKDLANRYGIRESTVSRIANGIRRSGHSWMR